MRKKKAQRADFESLFGATKAGSSLLVLFVPSHNRQRVAIDQKMWVRRSLEVLGRFFGGATAYPRGQGVWRDDDQGGRLLFDEAVVIQCYASEDAFERHSGALREFLVHLGRECRQGGVGFVLDGDYSEIRFPLSDGLE